MREKNPFTLKPLGVYIDTGWILFPIYSGSERGLFSCHSDVIVVLGLSVRLFRCRMHIFFLPRVSLETPDQSIIPQGFSLSMFENLNFIQGTGFRGLWGAIEEAQVLEGEIIAISDIMTMRKHKFGIQLSCSYSRVM